MAEKEVKKEKEKYEVREIPTQTAPAIVNTEKEEALTIEIALARILNELAEIKQQIK